MEIQIISKETIKPSSPTPHHLKTYEHSAMDLHASPLNVSIILFYSPTNGISSKNSDNLKRSFAKSLAKFYPFAGRIKDDTSVECNDEGGTYIEARVTGNMSIFLQQPDIHQLEQLQSCKSDGSEVLDEQSTRVMLAVQVNYFDCGGIAVSVCVNHRIADASSLASFVKCWGAISCGLDDKTFDYGVVVDRTSLHQPPKFLSGIPMTDFIIKDSFSNKVVKRFMFEGPKIAALRGKLSNGPYLDHPTRVEAVSAVIWGAFVGEENESRKVNKIALHVINLRKRLDPQLPQHCIGNVIHFTQANWPAKEVDYNGLAGKIHESISMVNNDYVRQVYADDAYFSLRIERMAKIVNDPSSCSFFAFSSWCRFPFYEVDFGWGKPTWVGTATSMFFLGGTLESYQGTCKADTPILHQLKENTSPYSKLSTTSIVSSRGAFLLDTRDGEGIEAWLTLPKEDMVKFEKNPDILAYASFTFSI